MNSMLWIKRFILILLLTVVGYFLVFHAGMSSDQDEYLKWYYKVELIFAGLLCWPISIYIGVLKLVSNSNNILGFEIWFFQLTGYFCAFKIYDKHKKT